jgi:peptidoglycan/xylan/chitin deacetylase (PgdA/CDA1 family)
VAYRECIVAPTPLAPVPILLYHATSADPPPVIRPFAVTPETFRRQLDAVLASGVTVLTISELLAARDAGSLPPRPAAITFDDGFADFYEIAQPALRERGLPATLYIATALLRGRPWSKTVSALGASMLDWSLLRDVAGGGTEIGAHSHTHPHLDTLSRAQARDEIVQPKRLLEDELQQEVPSFAYPNGYSSPSVRQLVRDAGYRSACSVKNAFSSPDDDRFSLARLTIRSTTSLTELEEWLDGRGAPPAPERELARTRGWRLYRRAKAAATRRPTSDLW